MIDSQAKDARDHVVDRLTSDWQDEVARRGDREELISSLKSLTDKARDPLFQHPTPLRFLAFAALEDVIVFLGDAEAARLIKMIADALMAHDHGKLHPLLCRTDEELERCHVPEMFDIQARCAGVANYCIAELGVTQDAITREIAKLLDRVGYVSPGQRRQVVSGYSAASVLSWLRKCRKREHRACEHHDLMYVACEKAQYRKKEQALAFLEGMIAEFFCPSSRLRRLAEVGKRSSS